jgi:putative lipoic acid-binding regulatory protein
MKYAKLKDLLDHPDAEQKFPFEFSYKFIGANTDAFRAGVVAWEKNWERTHPTFKRVSERESTNGNHLALTFTFLAPNSDAVVEIFRSIENLPEVKVVL